MRGLADVYADWIRRYRIDGFRIDTARHVNRAFFRLWVPRIMAAARAAGVPDFQLFGEAFLGDTVELSAFVRDRGLPTVLDFPLQDAIVRFAGGSAGALGIQHRLRDDDYFQTGNGVAHVPPTFVGNHDVGRAALKIQEQAGADVSRDELLRRTLLAHSLLYLLRGAPVVYYGDEVGIVGRGGDKQARHDLFPTQVSEWKTEARIGSGPIGDGSAFDAIRHPVAEHLRTLARLRDMHPALATGPTITRVAQRNILVVSRIDVESRHEYVAVFNSGTTAARVAVPTSTRSSSWTNFLGVAGATISISADLRLAVTVPPLTAMLLRAGDPLPSVRPPRPTLRVVADRFSDYWLPTVGGGAPVSVAFAVKRRTGGWTRLAVDDSPPYRAVLDAMRFRRNEQVHVVAIARGLGGQTAVSAVTPFTVRRR
jgi:hypothetical protein